MAASITILAANAASKVEAATLGASGRSSTAGGRHDSGEA
jgi:hypothetical protein